MKKTILPILLATTWISISEFVRNEFILKTYWQTQYENLGLEFPSEPINGAIWGFWSFLYAVSIFIISKKFLLWETTFLAWLVGFVLMWVVLWNMAVFPLGILPYAVPLSLFEAFLATYIIQKLRKKPSN